jgi:hypothetical protein
MITTKHVDQKRECVSSLADISENFFLFVNIIIIKQSAVGQQKQKIKS